MKKVYLIVSSIAFGSLAFGQTNQTFMNKGEKGNLTVCRDVKEKGFKGSTSKASGDILYSQDFSAGTIGDMTTSGSDGALWLNDLDGSNGQYAGVGAANTSAIANADAVNGFAILDADLNTTNFPTHADPYDGQLVSPAIDLSTSPGALLNFYCKYRYWGAYYQYPVVQISTDNFATFTEFNIGREGIRTNDGSGTYFVSLNLSQFLNDPATTNKSNFKFRISSNNLSLYYMEVDDIKVIEAFQNDVQLSELWLEDINTTFENTDIPTSIASAAPLTVQAHLINKGYGTPTNTTLSVGIYTTSGAQVGATQTGGTSSNNFTLEHDTITFITTFDLSTLAVGTYTVRADVNITETDGNTDNDTMRRTMNRTDYSYGQRNYDLARTAYSPGVRYGSFPLSNPMTFGNVMYVPNDITLHGLEVTIANSASFYSTSPDAEIVISLYQMDYSAVDYTSSFGGSLDDRFFKVTADMIPADGSFKDVIFNFHDSESSTLGMNLTGGNYYYIGFSHPGGDYSFSFASNFDDFDASSNYFDETQANVYVIGRQAHTRMNFDPQLAIDAGVKALENNGLSFGDLYPNPTTGQTSMNYKLENSSEVSIKVVDITGKVVYSSTLGTQNKGAHTLSLDAASYTNGVYYVTISANDTEVTKKMIKN